MSQVRFAPTSRSRDSLDEGFGALHLARRKQGEGDGLGVPLDEVFEVFVAVLGQD
jgi:hypothetical protein